MNAIGVSCTGFSKEPFDKIYESVSSEFTHWEIFSELDHYLPSVCEKYGDLIRNSPLTFSLHTGIADINVASTNELIREASVANIVSEMEAAVKLDIDTATIHPGVINMAVKGTRERSIRQARVSMRELERYAEDLGICACIENMPNFPVMLGVEADELHHIIEGTNLAVCFDIGHANTYNQIDRMVDLFGDRIQNVHIHDNLGKSDDHMTIGEGLIDFKYVLSRLNKYSRRFIIESKTFESAVVSKTRLERLFSNQ